MNKDKVSLTLDKSLIEAIDKLSVQVARSRSDTINLVLKQVMADTNILQNIQASGGTAITTTTTNIIGSEVKFLKKGETK